jgi:preprotein translocase subunit SecG
LGGGEAARYSWKGPSLSSAAVYTVLSILQIFIAVTLVFLVLLHSGKDSGLSGAFGIGGAGAGPFGGGSLVERNLNRWTVAFGVALFVNSVLLLKT